MKIVKIDTDFAIIEKWFQEIASFISNPSLSHVEVKLKESEFIELDIFYDNHEHVFRIKFMDNVLQDAIKQIINPKPLFRREVSAGWTKFPQKFSPENRSGQTNFRFVTSYNKLFPDIFSKPLQL